MRAGARLLAALFSAPHDATDPRDAAGLFLVAFLDAGLSTSRAALGGVGSLSTGSMVVGAYAAGVLEARWGARRVVGGGAALAAVGLALTAASTEREITTCGAQDAAQA